MFDKAKYVTCGVEARIPLELQLVLWSLIDKKNEKKLPLDYLQVFRLEAVQQNSVIKQKIIHSQENPETKEAYVMESGDPVTTKIFVIDDGEYSTMLLAEEY